VNYIGGGVDVEIRILACEREDLVDPGEADVPAHDDEFGEVEENIVEIRYRSAGLQAAQGAGVTDLSTEGQTPR